MMIRAVFNAYAFFQLIGVTSFIDASLMYGSDDGTANSLRTFSNGMLRKQVGPNGKSYLPNAKKPSQSCNVANDNAVCYTTGNDRLSTGTVYGHRSIMLKYTVGIRHRRLTITIKRRHWPG